MTKEEKIAVLKALWRYKDCGYSEYEIRESLEMAIEELLKEPCEDCVSRKAVKNVLLRQKFVSYEAYLRCIAEIDNLPPATSTYKKGKWIRVDHNKVMCSECEITHLIAQYPHGAIKYCPNCGAEMESE